MIEIQERLNKGYTKALYGSSEKVHEQMTEDIDSLLILLEACKKEIK